eukprot:193218-Chlamydomonas_euryale.AAC.1
MLGLGFRVGWALNIRPGGPGGCLRCGKGVTAGKAGHRCGEACRRQSAWNGSLPHHFPAVNPVPFSRRSRSLVPSFPRPCPDTPCPAPTTLVRSSLPRPVAPVLEVAPGASSDSDTDDADYRHLYTYAHARDTAELAAGGTLPAACGAPPVGRPPGGAAAGGADGSMADDAVGAWRGAVEDTLVEMGAAAAAFQGEGEGRLQGQERHRAAAVFHGEGEGRRSGPGAGKVLVGARCGPGGRVCGCVGGGCACTMLRAAMHTPGTRG